MTISYSEELLDYMKLKKKNCILVEACECNNTEIEICELHVYLVDEKRKNFFLQKKGYGCKETEHGTILFPPMKLELSQNICFSLKKIWLFSRISYEGIRI